jgi:hypothetical protein
MDAFVVILIVLVVIGVLASSAKKREANQAWQQAAKRLGVHYKAGELLHGPELFGEMLGCRVLVGTVTRGESRLTRYRAIYPAPLGVGLKLSRQRAVDEVVARLGGKEIEIGDSRFDRGVRVRGRHPDQIRELLTESRRRRIERLLADFPGCLIEDSQITWETHNVAHDSLEIVRAVRQIVEVAQDLSAYHVEHVSSRPVRGAGLDGVFAADSTQAGPLVGELDEEIVPISLEQPVPQTEELAEDQVDDFTTDGLELKQIDTEYEDATLGSEWETRADVSETSEPHDPAPAAERVAAIAPADENTLGLDAALDELFGPDVSNADAASTFERRYRGRSIKWSGRLTNATPYPFDRVFGKERGAKAVVLLREVRGRFGVRVAQAVIQFPQQALPSLRSVIGESIVFTGVLLQYDPFMHCLFVKDGHIAESVAAGS